LGHEWATESCLQRQRLHATDEVELEEMIETIREGSMPPWQYKPTHPGARLSEQKKHDPDPRATFDGASVGSGEGEEKKRTERRHQQAAITGQDLAVRWLSAEQRRCA
jgi:heme-binding protein